MHLLQIQNLHLLQLIHYIFPHDSVQTILSYLKTYGYGFVFLGTIFEGELILLAAGFLCYLGALNFWEVLFFGFIGASVGDNLWYWVGQKGGTKFIERFGKILTLTKKRIAKAKVYFEAHGAKTIFFSRFIVGTRLSTSILAGALGMDQKKFIRSNIAGAATWAVITTGMGYLFGNSFELLRTYLRRTETALLILTGVVIIILLLRFLLTTKDI